jgi:MFS family permease
VRAALRHRDFVRYAVARFFATISWQMMGVAVGWQVYELTRDPLALGLVGLAQFLPFLALVLPGGFLADRVDRRLVMVFAYVAEAVCAATLLLFTLRGSTAIWPILVSMALFGAGRAFWMPTGQAMTVNLVPPELFPTAVGFNATLFQSAVIIGPALGGLLYAVGDASLVYATTLASLTAVIGLMASVRPVRPGGDDMPDSLRDVFDGLRFVWSRKPVLGSISLDFFAVLFGGATALLPIFARDILHVGPAGLGALRTAPGLGAAVIAALLALRPIRRRAGVWMFGGVALFGLATMIFGVSTSLWLSLAMLFLMGAGDMVSVFVRHLLVQLETPDAIRGRVSAVSAMFIGGSNELGEFESGITARWWGVVPAVVVGGAGCIAVVAAYLRLFPQLRRLDRFSG